VHRTGSLPRLVASASSEKDDSSGLGRPVSGVPAATLIGDSSEQAEEVLRRKEVGLDPSPFGCCGDRGLHRKTCAAKELLPGSCAPVVHRLHSHPARNHGSVGNCRDFQTECLQMRRLTTAEGGEQTDLRRDSELAVDGGEMIAHRAGCQAELAGNLGAAAAFAECADDLDLA